ncbi:FAD dependent oxidoreductase [Verrucomicrobium sp. GAS474]|uniref:FAD-dependent oxidoreductase n=1 Tax=Verrucomicrobium sp. GAS474 TaxID=1882831 RepID=UPI00087B17E0|nr:FAD-dependent oxidoreductase [Verrucomicrobium sp. GAS474]SDU05240.1 FAD dependent oxidoreductase [Verrucomicrobium sp. GAS474]
MKTRSVSTDRSIPVRPLTADFVVVGGGMAGVCAAVSAARNGLRVVLVQDRSVLGGNASSEVKMHIVGADCHGARPGAREAGLIEEFKLEDAVRNPYRSYAQWDLLLYEKVKLEPNITLLLDTACIGATTDPATGAIRSVTALRNSTEEIFEISAAFFADCSGDSRLGREAGADARMGRENRQEHGESLAEETSDDWTLGSSILLTGKKHATPQPFRAPSWIRKFTKADLNHRPIHSFEYGYWWFEWGGHLDTITDNETIRHELLRIVLGIWDYVKNSGDHPDAANWSLDWVGPMPAKRESRRLLGDHILTQSDLQSGRFFPDAVAYGGWAIDLHPPRGIDEKDEPPFTPTYLDGLYTIPLRSLFSRNVPNLLFAGRNISASHVAFASTRVMATCAVMGQAIGTAAAVALEKKVSLKTLAGSEAVKDLQQRLLKDDAFIPMARNEDPADLAQGKNVAVSASSEAPKHGAARVLDGIGRDLVQAEGWNGHGLGPWIDHQPHHWQSSGLPASLDLAFPEAVEIGAIHLTFDSGFGRELLLTPSDYMTSKVVRGPQPETVKSYRIHADGVVIVEEPDNYLRKRVHTLAKPVRAKSIRVEVLTTHGAAEARLFEIRVYAPAKKV